MELIFVFGRLLFASVSNVFQKKLSHQGLHPFYIVAATYLILALLAAPLLGLIKVTTLSNAFWLNVFLASLLDVGGWMFLVMSLSKTDLSVFGPLNAYKVIISMVLAILFLGEIPNLQGLLGVLVILAGSFFLMPAAGTTNLNRVRHLLLNKGVQARFLSILLFSVGTVFLKNSVIYASPLDTLIFWSLMGLPLILIANQWFLKDSFIQSTKKSLPQIPTIILVGAMVFIMQYLTLVLLSRMLVVYTLALFQLGMVLQVFLGYRFFQEPHFLRRMLACFVMMIGSVLVLMT
ncbi:MAG: multidrug transporter [Betaproteobacteria bacterium HGW-Betaproteobacteria-20]|nr:MAG: multidrug transporter [Betaproteobacteria bacterium HGW-Betaproteobacteria-20]